MPDWVGWMIAAGVLGIGEIFTPGLFVLGPIAIAALLAAIVGLAGVPIEFEVVAFAVGSLTSLGVLRPIARRHLRMPAAVRTGTRALIGADALVLQEVNGAGGLVKIGGEVWSARPYDGTDVIAPGAHVQVLEIKGATALVAR